MPCRTCFCRRRCWRRSRSSSSRWLQAVVTSLYHRILWKPRDVRFIGTGQLPGHRAGRGSLVVARPDAAVDRPDRTACSWGSGLATALLLNQQLQAWRGLARSADPHPLGPALGGDRADVVVDVPAAGGPVQRPAAAPGAGGHEAVPWLAQPGTALVRHHRRAGVAGLPLLRHHDSGRVAGHPIVAVRSLRRWTVPRAWQQFKEVTLPGLKGVLVTAVMLRLIWVANSIDVILVMTGRRAWLRHPHAAAVRLQAHLRQHGLRLRQRAGGDLLAAAAGA